MHTSHAARRWYDVRILGPALLLAFGVVLIVAPPLNISPGGSIGHAGVHLKDPNCPPNGGGGQIGIFADDGDEDECPDPDCPPGNLGSAGVQLNQVRTEGRVGVGNAGGPPMQHDCPSADDDCPDAPHPGGGGGGFVSPSEECPEGEPVLEDPPPFTEVEGEVVEMAEEAPAADVESATELPFTGERSTLLLVVGIVSVLVGGGGLVAARRLPA